MTIHDLSVPVVDGADWYDFEVTPPVRVTDIGDMEREGWVSHVVELAVVNGTTYLETAAHVIEGAPLLDEIPPERFLCKAHVVSCQVAGQQIVAPAEPLPDFRPGEDALLVHCGWETHRSAPDYYRESPYFASSLQAWLLDHQPAILGGDMLSFDHPEDADMPFVNAYFAQGGMILCPLQGLAPLSGRTLTMCAAPTKLANVNCAPCRVLAWEEPS